MTLRLSVVIPSLNEARHLPTLLDSLDRQTRRPDEIVIADAGSTDGTLRIAEARGICVVPGGHPGLGRNAGAAATSGDLIMFLDADTELADAFIASVVAEFIERGYSAATARPQPSDRRPHYLVACGLWNLYQWLTRHIAPHASGCCILVWRSIHERLGGFDESLVLAEDHNYARRVAEIGKFGVFTNDDIMVSMRRWEGEDWLPLARKYIYSERLTLKGTPIRAIPFEYASTTLGEGEVDARAASDASLVRRLQRILQKPSTEVQGDAIGALSVSVVAGAVITPVLASVGFGPEIYLSFAGVALLVAVVSAYVSLRKMRFERHYGEFFVSSPVVASDDIRDASGRTLIRKGVDEVSELHVISHLARMSQLSRQGLAGRLTISLDALRGMRAMSDDMADAFYADTKYVTARSDLVGLLLKMGFDEVPNPPELDVVNRVQKRLLLRRMGKLTGRDRSSDLGRLKMALISKEKFAGEEFKAALDIQIDRVTRDLERLRLKTTPVATAQTSGSLLRDSLPSEGS
ncbi:MAG: glycosyltransferase [Coriobacteriia bacterium]|nr:glycosyltransferase [Coriobacteriia bacterium]